MVFPQNKTIIICSFMFLANRYHYVLPPFAQYRPQQFVPSLSYTEREIRHPRNFSGLSFNICRVYHELHD